MTTNTAVRQNLVVEMIDGWVSNPTRGLMSRKAVIDMLLDVRLEVGGDDIEVVDAVLADVPGVTTVESKWWAECLDELKGSLDAYPVD